MEDMALPRISMTNQTLDRKYLVFPNGCQERATTPAKIAKKTRIHSTLITVAWIVTVHQQPLQSMRISYVFITIG